MADEITDRIERMENELADLKAVHEAGEEMARQVEEEDDEPFGLDRLRGVQRKSGPPNQQGDE